MATALLALVGFFVSLYLWFWKIGVLGVLACGDGGCETVQLSAYASVFGIPVSFLGVVGYLGLIVISLLGLQPRWAARREPTVGLAAAAALGVAFSGYLTYLEASVIHAWCRWCVVSAIVIGLILLVSLVGLWSMRRARAGSERLPEPTP